jgi:hypothetical protein
MPIGRGGGTDSGDEGEGEGGGLAAPESTALPEATVDGAEVSEVTLPVTSLSDGWATGI